MWAPTFSPEQTLEIFIKNVGFLQFFCFPVIWTISNLIHSAFFAILTVLYLGYRMKKRLAWIETTLKYINTDRFVVTACWKDMELMISLMHRYSLPMNEKWMGKNSKFCSSCEEKIRGKKCGLCLFGSSITPFIKIQRAIGKPQHNVHKVLCRFLSDQYFYYSLAWNLLVQDMLREKAQNRHSSVVP